MMAPLVSIYVILICFYTAYAPPPPSPPAPVEENNSFPWAIYKRLPIFRNPQVDPTKPDDPQAAPPLQQPFFRIPFFSSPPPDTSGSQLPSQPLKEGETLPSGWPTPTRPEEMPPKKGFAFQFPILGNPPQNVSPKVKTLPELKEELTNIIVVLPALSRRSINLNKIADKMSPEELQTKIQEIKDKLQLLVGHKNKNGEMPHVILQKKMGEVKEKVAPHVTQFLEDRGKAVKQTAEVIGSHPITQAIGNSPITKAIGNSPISKAIGGHPIAQNIANLVSGNAGKPTPSEQQDPATITQEGPATTTQEGTATTTQEGLATAAP